MKFDQPAGINPIDRGLVVGKSTPRVEGPLKVTGTARYAYERHDAVPNAAYGVIVGSAIATGAIRAIDISEAEKAPGVLAIVTHENAGPLGLSRSHPAPLLGGPRIHYYDQALALVVAESFEAARDAAMLVRIDYAAEEGRFDLAAERSNAPPDEGRRYEVGDFDTAFAAAAVQIDREFTTAGNTHAMMEPHATTAAWDGDRLALWSGIQRVAGGLDDLAATLMIPRTHIRIVSPHVGGGFGAKLWIRADAVLAALGARAAGRPVKVALARAQVANNTFHRAATIQRVRIGASADGLIDAIEHLCWVGNLPGGFCENAVAQTQMFYRGAHRRTLPYQAVLNLPEANAMRAPGDAPGNLAVEAAMDELAEACGIDPVELRFQNDIKYDPAKGPSRPFSERKLVECLRVGAERFGWSARHSKPGQRREGRWLIGMGVAAAARGEYAFRSAARVQVDRGGHVVVETDMTDIGTGSYTVIAQTAAEMLGVPLAMVEVRLGDSDFPVSCGSGGQFGANSSTAGVYAACMTLRALLAQRAGFNADDALFEDGAIKSGNRSVPLAEAAGPDGAMAEDEMEYGDLKRTYAQATFGAHFAEVGVDIDTCEIRVRRQSGVFACGRILNPLAARSQIIGSMTMGAGAALMEALAVDWRHGYFVNRDFADYLVPTHADIPHQDVLFLDELDDKSSPMKAKGVGEVGICGAGAAIANAVYNATGVRIRDYPLTPDKLIAGME